MDFLNSCLQHNADKRPTWDELIKHPYVAPEKINLEDMRLHFSFFEDSGTYVAGASSKKRSIVTLNTRDSRPYEEVQRVAQVNYQKYLKHREEQENLLTVSAAVDDQWHNEPEIGVEDLEETTLDFEFLTHLEDDDQKQAEKTRFDEPPANYEIDLNKIRETVADLRGQLPPVKSIFRFGKDAVKKLMGYAQERKEYTQNDK